MLILLLLLLLLFILDEPDFEMTQLNLIACFILHFDPTIGCLCRSKSN